MTDWVSIREFHSTPELSDWRILSDGAYAFFRTASFSSGIPFVAAIGELDGVDEDPPDVDMRAGGVTVRLVTMNAEGTGISRRNAALAREVSRVAREHGLAADTSVLQSYLVVPGAPNTASVMPFWRAVLGYAPRPDTPDEDLVDPHDRGPAFWFEPMQEPRSGGLGAIHIAVWLPPEQAEARVAAALAAGGFLVRDRAPMWWTLADAAGNEADIATATGRD
jgi:4a-hydroxytetrahydrobiopterin dehydratase